jgi:hypothetical protein
MSQTRRLGAIRVSPERHFDNDQGAANGIRPGSISAVGSAFAGGYRALTGDQIRHFHGAHDFHCYSIVSARKIR